MRIYVILDIFLVASYLYLLPYVSLMLLTSLAAVAYFRKSGRKNAGAPSEKLVERRFLIAIPARNEEANVAETVSSCRAIDYPGSLFEVLVIADNCTDNTASRALEAGARVLERIDATRKSKGYAIEYLIDALKKSGELECLDALVFIDADSTVDSKILERFAMGLDGGSDWMQCYDCVGNADRSWRTRIMAYGFSLQNGITLAGQKALGLSGGFRGNGMCISRNGLRRVPWIAHGLVEDLEYSWLVRLAGERIDFIEDTAVFATMLFNVGTPLADQRRRWEFGRSAVCRQMLGPVLHSTHLSWPRKAAALAELTSHPTSRIALFYLLLSVALAFAIPELFMQKNYLLIAFVCVFHSFATLALAVHALSPFIVSLVPWRFASSFLYFPYYVLWRMRVLAKAGPRSWVPTQRERKNSATRRTTSGELVAIPPLQRDVGDDNMRGWRA
jgi:cellulose synthase/poly-beta-1,6-N-acetylglucosamine synthase-like glycosyltransferase